MTSQVIFKLDRSLKKKAPEKAKTDGLSFAAVLQFATRAYVEGRLDPPLAEPERPLKPRVLKQLKKISEDIQAGKNLSPAFDNVQAAIAWRKKQRGPLPFTSNF